MVGHIHSRALAKSDIVKALSQPLSVRAQKSAFRAPRTRRRIIGLIPCGRGLKCLCCCVVA